MSSSSSSTIALNKRARFEYQLEDRTECGISLLGWEVKSLRAGNVQFGESHVLLRNGEAFLFGWDRWHGRHRHTVLQRSFVKTAVGGARAV